MSVKRKHDCLEEDYQQILVTNKKHTLDSDEEDSDDYEKDSDVGVDGEEEFNVVQQTDEKLTPFNMREELEEGHFDKDGNYHWNKDSEARDNWLDNIDWVKIKNDKDNTKKINEELNDSLTQISTVDQTKLYTQILDYMQPNETLQRTLQRLAKSRKVMSSTERLKMKKMGYVDDVSEKITKFTELTNELLARTGNMDIYQKTYESIQTYLSKMPSSSKVGTTTASSDMYADDFLEKEISQLSNQKTETNEIETFEVLWEYKLKQEDKETKGPYSTKQMMKWKEENYFKKDVFVRKVGDSNNFYKISRIDFDLYP